MTGLIGVIALFVILALSLIITRVATVALTMTGLSKDTARFQARSAFTGTGFTTTEAENVVNHPVRRKIIMILMVVRSAGLVTVIFSFILSFLGTGDEKTKLIRLGWLVLGVAVLWLLASSKRLDRYMSYVINWALRKWTNLELQDYASLLRLSGEYRVMKIQVKQGDWIAGKKLRSCYLPEEGITVLGIVRSEGSYVGGPKGDTEVFPEDTLILYGRAEKLRDLDTRRADATGDIAHDEAVNDEKRRMEKQDEQEKKHKEKRQAGLVE